MKNKNNGKIPAGAYLGGLLGALTSVSTLLSSGHTPRTPEEMAAGVLYSTVSTLAGSFAGGFCHSALESYFKRERRNSLEEKLEGDKDG